MLQGIHLSTGSSRTILEMSQTSFKKDREGNNDNDNSNNDLTRFGLKGNDLFKKGNVGIARLLIAISKAGPDGMRTLDLLKEVGAIHYGQTLIKDAYRLGLIDRLYPKGVRSEESKGYPRYNVLTPKGRALLRSQLKISI